MEIEFFKKLALDEHFHDLEGGYEFKKVAQSDTYCTCQCTRKIPFDETTVKVGEILSIYFDAVAIEDLILGKYPDNSKHLYIKTEQPQPEQHSTELKTMLIADAIKAGLKVGAKVWIEVEVMKLAEEYDSEYLSVYTGSTGIFYLPKDKTEILFKPQPFTPKHGEKCRVETTKGNIYNCIAAILEDDYFAVIKNGEVNGVFQPSEIKQFLPL